MPERAGSTPPEDTVPLPGLRLTGGHQEQHDVVLRQARLRWSPPWFVEHPSQRSFPLYGDLVEGGVAVASLLAMLAIGLPSWLAIPLAVLTYLGITLLRPPSDQRGDTVDDTVTEHPGSEAMAGDGGHEQLPDGALTGVDAVGVRFGLTRREREILPLLAHRLTDREIAGQLSISHRTAMNHTANILGKLGLASRRDVAAFVTRHALQPPSTPSDESE